jgi:predicted transcriptional regulator
VANCVSQFHIVATPLQKRYRSSFEIFAMMIEAVKENNGNGAPKFSIMRNTSINSAQLKKYLRSLSEMGFVELDNAGDRVVYRATDRGIDYLRQYNILQRMMFGTQS